MIKYDYSTNVVLEADSNRFQTLYSSQSYQSFYSVFGNFKVEENDSNSFEINSCNLEIINYKGDLNIEVV